MQTIRVMPIEGKDYRNTAEVKKALICGDDFIVNDGFSKRQGYINLAQMEDFSHVEVRFRNMRDSTIFNVLELQEEAL